MSKEEEPVSVEEVRETDPTEKHGNPGSVSQPEPTRWSRLWSSICTRYHNLEETLADLFGLNDSKYQWAIDEYFQQEEEKEHKKKLRAARREQKQREEDGEYTTIEQGGKDTAVDGLAPVLQVKRSNL
mmetsp:Transcript_3989/g.6825  ORF Transcript_3989/g.6825 Transcript_3989/m.6825 type:complete len:128 (+) Transcript_3989:82-465(+)